KTQSALLEAMEERQVTIDGVSYPLANLYMVVATQNPVEYEGTYPLPEAQLDRFLFKVLIDYPTHDEGLQVLRNYQAGFNPRKLNTLGVQPAADSAAISAARAEIAAVKVAEAVLDYIERVVEESRSS